MIYNLFKKNDLNKLFIIIVIDIDNNGIYIYFRT
jgi:hypothetical protein